MFDLTVSMKTSGKDKSQHLLSSFLQQNELVFLCILLAVIGIAIATFIPNVASIIFKRSKQVFRKRNDLKIFPELPSLPFIGPLYCLFQNKNDLTTLLLKWRQIYGPCWRAKLFGREIISIHDPVLLKTLLQSKDIGHLEKITMASNTLIVGKANKGLLSMPAKDWIPHRKAINSLFTFESLKNYIQIYKKHADLLVKDIISEQKYQNDHDESSDKPFYSVLIHVKALDIITEILTGVPLEETLGRNNCVKFHEKLENIQKITSRKLCSKPWQLVPFIWYFHPLRRKLNKYIFELEAAVQKMRKRHVLQPESKFALDMMINAKWSDDEIIAQLITLIVGGHETISSNFKMQLWLLAIEKEHQMKCQQEVDQLFDFLEQSGQELTLANLSELKYLERCVKESLRLFPSAPLGTHRELMSPLKFDNGIILKPGTLISYCTYVLHRDPDIYPNPERFDPDRFSPENCRKRSAFAYLPFSAGARNCVGWKSALLELTVLSAVILHNFELSTTDKREDIKVLFGLVLMTDREPNIIFKRRQHSTIS